MRFQNIVFVFFVIVIASSDLMGANQGADFFQSIGKIYVVVTVMAIIFLGLALYLFRMDKRISHLEKKSRNE